MLERAEDKRNQVKVVDIEGLVPSEHLLRKRSDFDRVYGMVEHLYSEDSGRPAADPMVLVKMALLQHLYGIRSLRQTVMEINMNIAYRWFLHYDLDTKVPHFATVSYAFCDAVSERAVRGDLCVGTGSGGRAKVRGSEAGVHRRDAHQGECEPEETPEGAGAAHRVRVR